MGDSRVSNGLQQRTLELEELLVQARESSAELPPSGTRVMRDAREMLRSTRVIEAGCEGSDTTLFVGFQEARRFAEQYRRYERLTASGVAVVAFGVGIPDRIPVGMSWIQVPCRPIALENQWFLTTQEPVSATLIGFEVSPQPHFGTGPSDHPTRSFVAFTSGDPRLAQAVVRLVGGVAAHAQARIEGPRIGRAKGG
jgi:hypothetical protein